MGNTYALAALHIPPLVDDNFLEGWQTSPAKKTEPSVKNVAGHLKKEDIDLLLEDHPFEAEKDLRLYYTRNKEARTTTVAEAILSQAVAEDTAHEEVVEEVADDNPPPEKVEDEDTEEDPDLVCLPPPLPPQYERDEDGLVKLYVID